MTINHWPETWSEHSERKGLGITYMAPKRYIRAASDLCGAIGIRYLKLATWAKLADHGQCRPEYRTYCNTRNQIIGELTEIFQLMQANPSESSRLTERQTVWRYAHEELGDFTTELTRLGEISELPVSQAPDPDIIGWLMGKYDQAAKAQIALLYMPTRSYCFG
jgi:hypothetical protein